MLVDRIGQLVVLLFGDQAVVDDLAVGAVLVELVGGLAQVRRLPEGGSGATAFLDDLLLVDQLDEEDVPYPPTYDQDPEVTWATIRRPSTRAPGQGFSAPVLLELPLYFPLS